MHQTDGFDYINSFIIGLIVIYNLIFLFSISIKNSSRKLLKAPTWSLTRISKLLNLGG